MTFEEALTLIKSGSKLKRKGWLGSGMWINLVDSWEYSPSGSAAPVLTDLAPWIGMKTAGDKFVPWFPNQEDILGTDWEVVA